MIIDDFYIMFHKKSFKKSVNIIQMRVLFSMLDQTRIIDYFRRVALTISINKQSSTIQSICKSFVRVLLNKKLKVSHIAIDEIANLKTQRRLKVFKYELFTSKSTISTLSIKSNRFEIDRVCTSINERSRSSQAQDLKQSTNISKSISLQSITFFSTLRVNQSIKRFNVRALSISSSRIELICALIRVTITQLTFYFTSQLSQTRYLALVDVSHINEDSRFETKLKENER